MSRRHILVTGATGGLGGALVRELVARGQWVRATGRPKCARVQEADYLTADLADPESDVMRLVDGVDSVIHAAALSASWGKRADFEAANVSATQRLLDACDRAGVGRFIFISSPSIFAAYRDRPLIGEGDRPDRIGLNDYASTKLAAERLILAGGRTGMAHCVIRPRALVGEGDRVILPRLAELASKPRMPLPRGGKAMIELTDLRDAARAICDAEERAELLDGVAINISGGQPIAVKDLAGRLAEALGRAPRPIAVPMAIARPLAAMLEATARIVGMTAEPMLTRYTLATLAYTQTFDLEPARRLLGYRPQFDAVETLLAEARKMRA